ncbi:hypothetical protein LINPERHAP2_LOCUS44818, partial [Linum perenne]
ANHFDPTREKTADPTRFTRVLHSPTLTHAPILLHARVHLRYDWSSRACRFSRARCSSSLFLCFFPAILLPRRWRILPSLPPRIPPLRGEATENALRR